jgi:5S rRNA maturation endonuclease (ribonuclease M5)
MLANSAEDVAKHLEKAKRNPDGSWEACCPAHNDKSPSLSIKDGKKVPVLIFCHAGCAFEEITHALKRNGVTIGRSEDYLYQGYKITRQYNGSGKKFIQSAKNGSGYITEKGCMDDVPRMPYCLEGFKGSDSVFIVEGEKDVNVLAKYGIPATCNSGGANNWDSNLNQYFKDKLITIIPDNDKAGHKHAKKVASELQGVAKSIEISNLTSDMGAGADISDWVASRNEPEKEALLNAIQDGIKKPSFCLDIKDWVDRDIEPFDFLMGELFSTTSRAFLIAPTGLGKSIFSLDMLGAMSVGKSFLHWQGKRPAKTLYVDGEMAVGLAKVRIKGMVQRLGQMPSFKYFNTEDASNIIPDLNFEPIDTLEGQIFMDRFIDEHGPFDFIILDNLMSLISGSMIDEEPWRNVLPWIKSLTARKIGCLVIDHTGNDTSKLYGTTTKKWQFDTVMLLKENKGTGADIAFTAEFLKNRLRTPQNRDDYQEFSVQLIDDQWAGAEAPKRSKKLPPRETNALKHLHNLMAEVGEKRFPMRDGPNVSCCDVELFRETLKIKGVTNSDKPASERSQWSAIKNKLMAEQVIGIHEPWVWICNE